MAKRKKHDEGEGEHENAERWLLTYADMITLLVAFFIMMYSMSVVNIKKFQAVAISIRSGFGGDFGMKGSSLVDAGSSAYMREKTVEAQAQQSRKTIKVVEKTTKAPAGEEPMNVYEYVKTQLATLRLDQSYIPVLDLDASDGNRLRVILTDRINFAPGSTSLTPEARAEVRKIGNILKDSTFRAAVDGYSIADDKDSWKGWSLSMERARQVAIVLVDEMKVNPRRLLLSGYGEWKIPGKARRLRMSASGAWERVKDDTEVLNERDVVVVSVIVK